MNLIQQLSEQFQHSILFCNENCCLIMLGYIWIKCIYVFSSRFHNSFTFIYKSTYWNWKKGVFYSSFSEVKQNNSHTNHYNVSNEHSWTYIRDRDYIQKKKKKFKWNWQRKHKPYEMSIVIFFSHCRRLIFVRAVLCIHTSISIGCHWTELN